MLEAARKAAAFWGLKDAPIELAAQRENTVFKVKTDDGDLALRFHRPGYLSTAELLSELQWMEALAAGGLNVPRPHPGRGGALIHEIEGQLVDVLSWLSGASLGAAGTLQGVEDRPAFCRALGQEMARLHDVSDAWDRPDGFIRPAWDRDGFLGPAPLWGRFWEHPDLTDGQRALLIEARKRANDALSTIEDGADYGLIHADLISENILWDGARPALIDFDDGGFGFREFELATFLLRFVDAPDYAALRRALCDGYAQRRKIDPAHLDLFILLRALTYPGWIMDRLDEPGGTARSERAIRSAVAEAERWLAVY